MAPQRNSRRFTVLLVKLSILLWCHACAFLKETIEVFGIFVAEHTADFDDFHIRFDKKSTEILHFQFLYIMGKGNTDFFMEQSADIGNTVVFRFAKI